MTINYTPCTPGTRDVLTLSDKINILSETHYTYTPSDARAARALCCDDVNAERAPWVCGVHGGLGDALGVHVAHFRPMRLTARNSLRHSKSPVISRTGPMRFDA